MHNIELNNIISFENAKRVCKLGYDTPSRYFYFKDGSIEQAYSIDINSELIWWVPTFEDIQEWLKKTYDIGVGVTPSLWDIDIDKDLKNQKITSWFFRCSKWGIVKDARTKMDAFNNGLSLVLDKIEENNEKPI